MTIFMYQASVPSLIRSLNNLTAILEKGAAYAEAKKKKNRGDFDILYPDSAMPKISNTGENLFKY